LNYQAGDSRRRLRPFLRSNCRITIACEPVLCDAHLGLHKITWSHKSGVGCGAALVVNQAGLPTAIDNHDGKLAPVYFRPLHHLPPLCVLPSVSTAAFCAPYTAPCLGGMGSKDGCTLPNALHGDVRRGLAAQQPTPHPIRSLHVWNIFFWFSFSASLLLGQLPTLALPPAPRFCH
jgi:hypothetical protein